MPRAKLWTFEDTEATIREIRAVVPCLSHECIQRHLEAGRNTRQAMLTFDSDAARRRGGRNGRRAVAGKLG